MQINKHATLLGGTLGLLLLTSCSIFRKSAKTDFVDGYYLQKTTEAKTKVYVDLVEEDIRVFPTTQSTQGIKIDTSSFCTVYKPALNTHFTIEPYFTKHSFDIDFLTIPLKYRPAKGDVPVQLNANLNGAAYFGYRTDTYHLDYVPNPFGVSQREVDHIGFSCGVFFGVGNSFISPTTTNNNINQEYDGLVWSKGIAGIFALNKVTLGVALGFDKLVDSNKDVWLYQNKPWLGIAFGLNLN